MLFKPKRPITEKRITLSRVSWETLEALLADLGNQRSTRITYYQGKLEILDPSPSRDRIARLLDSFLQVLADERGEALGAVGSQLLKHGALAIALQPDSCYYRGQAVYRGDRAELDLCQVPPPDLAIDLQFHRASKKRLGLFAGLGIPELWQYVLPTDAAEKLTGELTLFGLQDGGYRAIAHSCFYDGLSAEHVSSFIQHSEAKGLTQALTQLRSWLRSQGNHPDSGAAG